ncbi:hypothetical protein V9T40_008735 [Parthenolecanium corni]|uniref:Integrase catalytic domain-containing protein n=1 Tax=Parthenolecanium corni TaxID=536013 RepID=A0AAN9Y7G5_9HEMI
MEVKTANEFKNGIQFRKYLEDLLLSLNPVLPDDEMEHPSRHKSNIKQPEQLSHIQLEYITRQPTRPCRVDMLSNNTVVCSGDDSLAILLKDLSLSDDDFDIDYDKINFNDKISCNVNWEEVLNEMSLSSGDLQMSNKTEESDIPANLYPNEPTQTAILSSVACNTELLQSTTFKDTVFVPANCMTPNIFGNVSTINLFTLNDANTTIVTSNIHSPIHIVPDDLLTPCIFTKHHEGVQPKTPKPKKCRRVVKKPVQRRALYTEVDLSSSSSNSSWPANVAENITPTESQQNIKKSRNVKTDHQKEMMLGNIFPFRYDFWPRISKNKKQVKKTKPVPAYERRLGSIFPFKKSLFSSFRSVNKQLQNVVIPYTNPVTCEKKKIVTNEIDDIWAADLLIMNQYSRQNKGYNYIFNVIDTFSKYLFATPLKKKTGKEVAEAFLKILKTSKRCPTKLHVDRGKEFVNKDFQTFLNKYGITMYHTFNEEKSAIAERVNRTVNEKLKLQFEIAQKFRWIDVLKDVVCEYNEKDIHRSIGTTPSNVSKKNEAMPDTLYPSTLQMFNLNQGIKHFSCLNKPCLRKISLPSTNDDDDDDDDDDECK